VSERQLLESRCKVAQYVRSFNNAQTAQLISHLVKFDDRLSDIVHVTLRIDTPRYGQPNKFQRRVRPALPAEHHAADFTGADAREAIQAADNRLTGKLLRWYVRTETRCIEINRMTARRTNDGDAGVE
jgi:hypothetical protein